MIKMVMSDNGGDQGIPLILDKFENAIDVPTLRGQRRHLGLVQVKKVRSKQSKSKAYRVNHDAMLGVSVYNNVYNVTHDLSKFVYSILNRVFHASFNADISSWNELQDLEAWRSIQSLVILLGCMQTLLLPPVPTHVGVILVNQYFRNA
jgi:hypothetical protein